MIIKAPKLLLPIGEILSFYYLLGRSPLRGSPEREQNLNQKNDNFLL
jgi:hypothetical protein